MDDHDDDRPCTCPDDPPDGRPFFRCADLCDRCLDDHAADCDVCI